MAKRRKKKKKEETPACIKGQNILSDHNLFGGLYGRIIYLNNSKMGKDNSAKVNSKGEININQDADHTPIEWANIMAHNLLHLAFGHFDAENMPGYKQFDAVGNAVWKVDCDIRLWNIACDIYITKFLSDIKFGKSIAPAIESYYKGKCSDEREIYANLLQSGFSPDCHVFGTGSPYSMDMIGLEDPLVYEKGEPNEYVTRFANALAWSVREAIDKASGEERSRHYYSNQNEATYAARWFIDHYPLLGGLASGFSIIYDNKECITNDISIAAVDVATATIFVNPAAVLNSEELKFVLAHEYLHAGLQHHERCQGRDPYLWNVACDFVINGWLKQMNIGEMPERGILYDPQFDNTSAEEVYDRIVTDFRAFAKLDTLRGYGKGDVLGESPGSYAYGDNSPMDLDEFYRSALQNGLSYHHSTGRGFIPAGLEQEIRALSMPPIPWDVKLAKWFDVHFAPVEKRRTYARPSRRQGSTPDIPRPRMILQDSPEHDRTFGVVIDTSGSMSAKQIGYALGAIASYADAKEVPFARVVFCDADAYDAGYLAPVDIAGRVMVKGRGGTALQPGIDCLKNAKDFPKDGPILIITDGEIESHLSVGREHAYLLPSGKRLPFRAKGEVFYFKELKS